MSDEMKKVAIRSAFGAGAIIVLGAIKLGCGHVGKTEDPKPTAAVTDGADVKGDVPAPPRVASTADQTAASGGININGDINGPAQIGGSGNRMYLGRPPRQLTDELGKKLLRAIPKSKKLSVGVVSHDDDLYAGQIRDFLVSQGYSVAKPINFVLTTDTTTDGLLLDDRRDSDDWSITVFPNR